MKYIKDFVDQIDEELEGAKEYAETYLELKAKNDSNAMTYANRYKQMAQEELQHANNIHDRAVAEINQLSNVYTPPADMQEKWDLSHKKYVEKAAWIKQMLTL